MPQSAQQFAHQDKVLSIEATAKLKKLKAALQTESSQATKKTLDELDSFQDKNGLSIGRATDF